MEPNQKIESRPQGLPARTAFLQALATVAPGVLIACALCFYFVHPDAGMWVFFLFIIVMPTSFLLFAIYSRYQDGYKRPQLTRRQNLKRSLIYGFVAVGYLLAHAMDSNDGWRSWHTWLFTVAWLLCALEYLRRAYKTKEEILPPAS